VVKGRVRAMAIETCGFGTKVSYVILHCLSNCLMTRLFDQQSSYMTSGSHGGDYEDGCLVDCSAV
jgi:hypothetical protein